MIHSARFIAALTALMTFLIGAAPLPCPAAAAEPSLQLGAPFADHAVLQREMKVPVWGWDTPGATITVTFAGQEKQAVADAEGAWQVTLDPMPANATPRTMTIASSSGTERELVDLLVGEVWMASGQSNMQWIAGKSAARDLEIAPLDGVVPIREFDVQSVYAMLHPIRKATGAWKHGEYSSYSAIALAFAQRLYEELGVPIGILNCSFSQTQIQAWVPREGFRDGEDAYTKAIYKKVLTSDPATPEHREAWHAYYAAIETTLAENAKRLARGEAPVEIPTGLPGNMSGNRDATWLYNGRLSPVVPYAIRGAIWNQGYANMWEGYPYYHNLHSLVRGWRLVWDRPALPVYFHQFYTPGRPEGMELRPSVGGTADMRFGTWMARDIPHTGMASQIDVEGAIHYGHKVVPGRRLARHALKHQYGRELVVDGPMYRDYTVKGDAVTVSFDHADGGLVVAETGYNAVGRHPDSTGFADPHILPDGADQVELFYLAGPDRVWHPASVTIKGDTVVLKADGVSEPRGVSYGTGGIGFNPNLYNEALLPMTPFTVYDHTLIHAGNWPDEKMQVAGHTIDPDSVGVSWDYRRLALLSAQFRDDAVLQAGQPVTIWGAAVHPWHDYVEEGEAVVHFRFGDIEKTIPVTEGMKEWQVTLPAMPASDKPHTLHVRFTVDGELAHERIQTNIVFGDVWYVCTPTRQAQAKAADGAVRTMTRKAKRDGHHLPSRYSVCVSTTPNNRFASDWKNPDGGFAAQLGTRIHAITGNPVGIVLMSGPGAELKHWIAPECLRDAPSLMADYRELAALRPGTEEYDANARRFVAAWKSYWGTYIPAMIETGAVPDGATWGWFPQIASEVSTDAARAYNVMTHAFTPGAFKGVAYLPSDKALTDAEGAHYGEQVAALANCWKTLFGHEDPIFVYGMPGPELAPQATRPDGIRGQHAAVPLTESVESENPKDKTLEGDLAERLDRVAAAIVEAAYR